jgi:hypothetical protein
MAAVTAGAFLIGSVAAIPLWTVRAIGSTSAAAIAEEAVMAVVAAATGVAEAIDAARQRKSSGLLTCRKRGF